MTMVPTLLRQFRRSLQIKKISTNTPRVLKFAEIVKIYQSITVKKVGYLLIRTPPAIKISNKRCNN